MMKTVVIGAASCAIALMMASAAADEDDVVTAKVKAALIATRMPAVPPIQVHVFNGEVDLSGAVDSADSKAEAGRIVSAVPGVTSVRNDLEVRRP